MRPTLIAVLVSFLTVPAFAQHRDPLPVPDIPGYRTLKCDFHMHTVFSDGEVWPTTRIAEAWREGLDAIAITDHTTYSPHGKDVVHDMARPHQLALPDAERAGILLIPGVEINEGDIHFNAIFLSDLNALKGVDFEEAMRRARAQGGFVFWNHPGWVRKTEWFPLVAKMHDAKLFQGIELVNGFTYYPEAHPFVLDKSLTIISNSDVHSPTLPVYAGRTRPLTLVFARTADLGGIRDALFARRTAAWMGGEVWGSEEHLRELAVASLKFDSPDLKVKAGGAPQLVRLHNTTAIPVKVRLRGLPEWLDIRGLDLKPESVTAAMVIVRKGAPAGIQRVQAEVEVTNFHTGPGRNLVFPAPLRIEVLQ